MFYGRFCVWSTWKSSKSKANSKPIQFIFPHTIDAHREYTRYAGVQQATWQIRFCLLLFDSNASHASKYRHWSCENETKCPRPIILNMRFINYVETTATSSFSGIGNPWKTKKPSIALSIAAVFAMWQLAIWLMPQSVLFRRFWFCGRASLSEAPPWIPLDIFFISKTGLECCRWHIQIWANSALWQCERKAKAAASQRVRMRMTMHFLRARALSFDATSTE